MSDFDDDNYDFDDRDLCMEYEYLQCCGLNELIGFYAPGCNPPQIVKEAVIYTKKMAFPPRRKDTFYNWATKKHETHDTQPKGQQPSHIIFSDINQSNWNYKGGNAFAKYIKKNKLGVVRPTLPAKNPNSGNLVKAWLWTPNWTKIKKHNAI